MTLSPPKSSLLNPKSRRETSRRGATLLVTLGILTVLSVLVLSFLVTSRLQRQTAVSDQNRLVARNQLNEALHLAMRTVEDALCYTNFTDETTFPANAANLPPQRLAPVGRWFSERWSDINQVSENTAFQASGLIVSPLLTSNNNPSAWTARILTPEVLALVPPALTNALAPTASTPLRVGWQLIDAPALNHNGTRIAFAVFDVSGFLDANYFVSGPTIQKHSRAVFSQADVTYWLDFAETEGTLSNLTGIVNASLPASIPFSSLSYDPDPDADPFASSSTAANPQLGRDPFARSRLRKFDINSITNMIGVAPSESGNWLTSAALMGDWLRPVYSALSRANASEPDNSPEKLTPLQSDKLTPLQSVSVPWNILNFIDGDRIPQISPFANLPDSIERIATRANLAIEDVPLINKVTVFDIGEAPGNHDADDYYGINNYFAPDQPASPDVIGATSNHYAVAVELWYPFAPAPLPPSTAFYAVLSTNAADTATTTNRPLTSSELEDWFRWNEAATSNSVMQILFYAWANAYTNAVGTEIWSHPLWQIVTTNGDAWFTTNMVNHPSWPVADTNGVISITNTPIWRAFYPDTYEVVVTNQSDQVTTNGTGAVFTNTVDVVTTNVYTYATTTNAYLHWVSEPDMTTNRFIGQIGVTDPDPYPVLLWSDPAGTTFTTNVLWGFTDLSGGTNSFFTGDQTNHLLRLYATPPDAIGVVFSNGLTGAVSNSPVSSLVLAPWTTNAPLSFTIQTNLSVETEILPLEPLPMPPELGAALGALFGLLLSPELSLDTSDELYAFLMLRPSEFGLWDFLFGYLAAYPFVQETLMPSVSAPRTDNLFPEDRIDLTDEALTVPRFRGTEFEGDKETVAYIFDKFSPPPEGNTFIPNNNDHGFGTYITIYPRKTVSFPEVTIPKLEDGSTDPDAMATTNYCALGSKGEYVLYLRPIVTLDHRTGISHTATPDAGGTLIDVLDEALLVSDNGGNVFPFRAVTNLCVADPRHNAAIQCWRGFPHPKYPSDWQDWDSAVGTTNLSTEVTEYPFIHFNAPFTSIGDIGHVYTSPDRLNLSELSSSAAAVDSGTLPPHDTISFASRSGAALLDLFTVHATPTNLPPGQTGTPWRGLVQANTQHAPVIQTLFSYGTLGWTNATATSDQRLATLAASGNIEAFSQAYSNALVNTPPVGMGWRSFADMLPAISTNDVLRTTFTPPTDAPAHDWIEDALRHLPDKVSFRQNIFVVVVAAQALSPASTEARPIVLSDQRAAVTVIRDAYTGRWVIHSWIWLTE